MKNKKIFRSVDDCIVAGICGGIAQFFEIDSSLIRILFVLLALGGGGGILIYIVLWLVIPREKEMKIEEEIKNFTKKAKNKAKSMAKDIKLENRVQKMKKNHILAIVLILAGLFAIWNKVSPIKIDWDFFWPGILILTGVLLLFRK